MRSMRSIEAGETLFAVRPPKGSVNVEGSVSFLEADDGDESDEDGLKILLFPHAMKGACKVIWTADAQQSHLALSSACGQGPGLANLSVTVRLTRQGEDLVWATPNEALAKSTGAKVVASTALWTFQPEDLNKRYVVEAKDYTLKSPTTLVTYLYLPTNAECETSVYSGDALQCNTMPEEVAAGRRSPEVKATGPQAAWGEPWQGSSFGDPAGEYYEVLVDSNVSTDPSPYHDPEVADSLTKIAKGALLKATAVRQADGFRRLQFLKVSGEGASSGWVTARLGNQMFVREFRPFEELAESMVLRSKQAYAVEFEGVMHRPLESMLPEKISGRWHKRDTIIKNLVAKHYKGTWPEMLQGLVDSGNRRYYQSITEGLYFPPLKECMMNLIPHTKGGIRCSKHKECGLDEFCSTGDNMPVRPNGEGACKQNRTSCKDVEGDGDPCPVSLFDWPWHFDASVLPMSKGETADAKQWDGVPVEIVSPGPPEAWPLRGQEGLRNIGEMITTMYYMGAQMGPSTGMHVHVNVQSKMAGGACCLGDHQVARVWVAYALYQLVLDEFRTPSRITNAYALGLYMADHGIASIFANIHEFVNGKIRHHNKDGSPDFCNSALGVLRDPHTFAFKKLAGAFGGDDTKGKDGKVCEVKGADERYLAMNLHPLDKKGTVEFRRHAGTHDVERILHWTQFVTAFVDAFKDDVSMDAYFDEAVVQDWRALHTAQTNAKQRDLFAKLDLGKEAQDYYAQRKWVRKSECGAKLKPGIRDITVSANFQPMALLTEMPLYSPVPDVQGSSCCCRKASEAQPCMETMIDSVWCCRIQTRFLFDFLAGECFSVMREKGWAKVPWERCVVGGVDDAEESNPPSQLEPPMLVVARSQTPDSGPSSPSPSPAQVEAQGQGFWNGTVKHFMRHRLWNGEIST